MAEPLDLAESGARRALALTRKWAGSLKGIVCLTVVGSVAFAGGYALASRHGLAGVRRVSIGTIFVVLALAMVLAIIDGANYPRALKQQRDGARDRLGEWRRQADDVMIEPVEVLMTTDPRKYRSTVLCTIHKCGSYSAVRSDDRKH